MNTILLGPLLGNNRAQLIERCADLVADNQIISSYTWRPTASTRVVTMEFLMEQGTEAFG